MGAFAGYGITTGGANTGIGYQSGYFTTGTHNTSVGHESCNNGTTGSHNVGIGESALHNLTTGSYNVAVGRDAGLGIVDANRNTVVGYKAGDALTSGSDNTLLGFKTGNYQTNMTTGDGNTIIGAYSDPTDGTDNFAFGLGYNLDCAGDYVTLGNGTSDIRAANGSTTWSTVSDERYKKDIQDSTVGLSFIKALRPRTFNYKNKGELPDTFRAYEEGSTEVFKSDKTQHGFIAQEVKAAIDAESGIKNGFKLWDERRDGSQEVAEAALIPMLVKAIQELEARIATLEG